MLVAVGTLVLTVVLYIFIPKGFFPLQDTGFIQAITTAGPTVSFDEMARRQQALAGKILQDTDVDSLSSFIGVDGTNNTLNSGRYPDQPEAQAGPRRRQRCGRRGCSGRHRGSRHHLLSPAGAGPHHRFRGEPRRVSVRAAAPTTSGAQRFRPQADGPAAKAPALANVSTDFLDQGLSAYLTVDRDTAARFGITAATIDNALYDSFGQRIISTIFTQSNQYRVILEADPRLQDPCPR